jgi:type IV secretion system protein VirB5
MQIRKIIVALSIASMLASSGAQATGIPVFDATTAANFLATLENDATKITALQSQVTSLQRQIDMNTGTRGMGSSAVSSAASEWGGILQQISTSTGSYGELVKSVVANQSALTPESKAKMSPAQQDIYARLWNLGAMQKVIADTTTITAARQLTEIKALSDKIDTADDPKAIADLNAALAAKKLELDNTRLHLYAMDQQMQAEQRLIEQRQRELAIESIGSRETVTIHIR